MSWERDVEKLSNALFPTKTQPVLDVRKFTKIIDNACISTIKKLLKKKNEEAGNAATSPLNCFCKQKKRFFGGYSWVMDTEKFNACKNMVKLSNLHNEIYIQELVPYICGRRELSTVEGGWDDILSDNLPNVALKKATENSQIYDQKNCLPKSLQYIVTTAKLLNKTAVETTVLNEINKLKDQNKNKNEPECFYLGIFQVNTAEVKKAFKIK